MFLNKFFSFIQTRIPKRLDKFIGGHDTSKRQHVYKRKKNQRKQRHLGANLNERKNHTDAWHFSYTEHIVHLYIPPQRQEIYFHRRYVSHQRQTAWNSKGRPSIQRSKNGIRFWKMSPPALPSIRQYIIEENQEEYLPSSQGNLHVRVILRFERV